MNQLSRPPWYHLTDFRWYMSVTGLQCYECSGTSDYCRDEVDEAAAQAAGGIVNCDDSVLDPISDEQKCGVSILQSSQWWWKSISPHRCLRHFHTGGTVTFSIPCTMRSIDSMSFPNVGPCENIVFLWDGQLKNVFHAQIDNFIETGIAIWK